MNMFLHVCCGPCSLYPAARLAEAGFTTTAFFYNPNIHPYQEYTQRLAAVHVVAERLHFPLIVHDAYDLETFLARTIGTGSRRCEQCYRIRLAVAAARARQEGFGMFTTTLLYSKYQRHDLVRGVGAEMAAEQGIELYYEDFRRGWRDGIAASKEMGLYRQQYCGCIFSERERYQRSSGPSVAKGSRP
jgi:predicted adenine nucleotide alpha hydrolase (AANH) superfamily ATPase